MTTLKKYWKEISLVVSATLNLLMGLGWLEPKTHAWLTELLGHVATIPQ